MKQVHRELKHFLISIMLDEQIWAHTYLMCDEQFKTTLAVDKMMQILEEKGVQIAFPAVLLTELEIGTAARIRELALEKASPEQVKGFDKAKNLIFCLWVTDDARMNAELEMIHWTR